jgi:hypothetical protein
VAEVGPAATARQVDVRILLHERAVLVRQFDGIAFLQVTQLAQHAVLE